MVWLHTVAFSLIYLSFYFSYVTLSYKPERKTSCSGVRFSGTYLKALKGLLTKANAQVLTSLSFPTKPFSHASSLRLHISTCCLDVHSSALHLDAITEATEVLWTVTTVTGHLESVGHKWAGRDLDKYYLAWRYVPTSLFQYPRAFPFFHQTHQRKCFGQRQSKNFALAV